MSTVIVQARFGDEQNDVREFIWPTAYAVQWTLAQIAERHQRSAVYPARLRDLWEWQLANIAYPPGGRGRLDYHAMQAYRRPGLLGSLFAAKAYTSFDFWPYPGEVLRDRMADCAGSTFLVVSLARAALPGLPLYATVGTYEGQGHVWGSLRGQDGRWYVVETTLSEPIRPSDAIVEQEPYRASFRFNERETIVVGDVQQFMGAGA